MKKRLLLVFGAVFGLLTTVTAQQRTTLSANVDGYQRNMIYFDCMQTPLIAQEFHTNPGEEHIYNFDCENLVWMTINGNTGVILQPGDSLHVNIVYEGKNVKVEYSGSEQCRKTKPVPGLVVSRRIAVRKVLQKCIEKDTSFVENDIKFK